MHELDLGRLTALKREELLKFLNTFKSGAAHAELPPIMPAERSGRLPLSFAQQRLWFLAQMEGASEAYHISFGLRLKGDLDSAALRRSLDRIVARHEALRTVFAFVDEQPVQRITTAEDSRFLLIEHDLRQHDDAQAELERLTGLEASVSFDLERGPLIRGRLIRLAEDEHALLLTMHHIVSDGWSMGLLVNELSALYGAFLRGEDDPLPELEIQYVDYAVWQRQWIEGEILQQQADYWKSALDGAPALLELPGDHPRPLRHEFAGAFARLLLDEQLTAGLKDLSRRHGTTLYMTLLAGWAALLARLSGQQDVVVGTPVANRGRAEIEGLIGFFVNTLAVRVDLSGSLTVSDLLAKVKEQSLAAQQHQDMPFEQVVELVQPVRSLSHSPLFQIMFAWQNNDPGSLQLPGLELRPLGSSPHVVAKFDLTLSLQQTGKSVAGGIEYATSLFEQATVERYLGYFRTLLEGMVADDTQAVDLLPMLPPSERHRVLYEWNNTKIEFPANKCVHQLFEEQVEKTPAAVAVVFEDQPLSYDELNRRANQVAHCLRELGVGPDDRVAICVERGFEMIVALMAVLKAGGAYVPLDPTYPAERLRFMLEDSAPIALLTQEHLAGLFSEFEQTLLVLDLYAAAPPWSGLPETNPDRDSIGLNSSHLAYVIYTSGSTGVPKGVAVEHGNTANFIYWAQLSFTMEVLEHTLFSTSLNFDLAVYECFVPITAGATVRVVSDALELARTQVDVTLINTVPSAMNALIEADGVSQTVRAVNLAGEVLKRTLVERIFATTKVDTVCNLYGPSETTTYSTWVAMRRSEAFVSHIGRPIANTRVYILDAHGEPVPVGVAGELYIGGAGVARGYLNRPELTAEKFLRDPFVGEPGARMYRTGDLGRYLPDGNIEFLGRNDFQVKIRGFRIELGEIEARLSEHPGVREAVVLAREDTPGDKRLVAYLVPNLNSVQLVHSKIQEENTKQWRTLYEETYSDSAPSDRDVPNLAGWNSSYTRQPIPIEEMQEQVASTVERLLALRPRRVLEIGCGTGLLLLNVAPHCDRYVGTDFSRNVIRMLQKQVAKQNFDHVELYERMANQFDGFAPESFDLVILNSIVQYFPSIDYLVNVLDDAVNVVGNGGVIQVGDVRNLALLEAYHLSVQCFQSPNALPGITFAKQLEERIVNEKELLIDPSFFPALKKRYSRLGHIVIQLRRGRHRNELTGFRYDAFLHFDVTSRQEKTTEVDWLSAPSGLATLNQLLRDGQPDNLRIVNVLNSRVAEDVMACHVLDSTASQTMATLRDKVRTALSGKAIDPEDLWLLGEKAGYETEVSWSLESGKEAYCDVLFRCRPAFYEPLLGTAVFDPISSASFSVYGNNPLKSQLVGIAVSELQAALKAQLPDYMVPAAYVHLESLPLTPNGKLDRKALPAPDGGSYVTRGYEAPQGEIEQKLAAVWAEVLKLDHIGRYDNFFSLGGHSLLAVTLIERMRRIGLKVDVRTLFATATLAALAAAVEAAVPLMEAPVNLIASDCKAITPQMLPLIRLSQEEIDKVVGTVPGGAGNVQDIYPLAPLQEGILFHYLMGGEGDPYLLAIQMSFNSRAQLDSYLHALQAVVDRHDILRTAVLWEGLPEPVQVVWRNTSLPIEEIELDPAAGDVSEQLYARFDPRRFRIDVRQAPLLRLFISYDAVHDRWLMMQLSHHLASDHTTLEVMHAEVQAHLLEQVDRLPAPLPFRNLVAQARLGISQQEHEDFFRQMLGDVNEPTAPFGLLDVQGDGTSIQQAHLALSDDLAWRLRANARRLGVSTASLCHLAWARVLSKVSGREDVVFGTVLFGRMQGGEGADRVMGLFINTLPVRIAIGEEGVEAAVRHTHTLLADLLRHEHASLALAQRCSAVPAPAPLFSALLNYRHSPGAAQAPSQEAMQAWQGIRWLRSEERTNYPFTLSVNDLGEGFSLTAQTPGSVGPIRVCELMRTALASLVEALETTPATAVLSLEVLPASERHRVLYEWNDTCTEFPSDKCVHELFEAQAEKTPDAVAVVFEDKSLSYADLNRRANQLAHYLRELGVRPDDRVAICVERSLEMIVALMAVLKAGGAYVPLDPTYPTERLRFMLDDSSPVALLTQNHLEDLFSEPSNSMPVIDTTDATAWQEQPETNPDQDSIGLTPNHLAYVIYTSGSTGLPKGVLIEHRGLGNLTVVHADFLDVKAKSRILQFASFSFDGCTFEVIMALGQGCSLHLAPQEEKLIGKALIHFVEKQGITHAVLPPAVLNTISEKDGLGTVNTLIVSGDILLDAPAHVWSHGRRLINGYGPTETTVCATLHECRVDELGNPPIGRPIANTRIYILDAYGEPVPVGVTGELYIGGAGVARGYLNRPEQTAEKFLGDPFVDEPGARMYRTGDLGRYLPDGNIEFLGRNDFQVKIRGFRIELGEIEAKLTEHPGVREAVVVAREDAPGDKRLVAYYTSSEEQETPEAGQLRSHLSVSLPDYMVPAAYVHLESLPLTPNGKLDRKALPAPDGGSYVTRGYEAPQGEIEQKLAAVWAEVLKLDHIGRYDNFFSLGGHSLLAVTLIGRMRRVGLTADVRTLFATPTLAALAAAVEAAVPLMEAPVNLIASDCKAITPQMLPLIRLSQEEIDKVVGTVPGGAGNVQDIYPLAPLQEGILFHYLMGGEGDPYLLAIQMSFNSRAQLDSYLHALQAVVDRHDILRTAVLWEGLPEPVQVVWRNTSLPIEEIELDPAAGDVSEQLYARFDPRRFRIDVRQAPLLRLFISYDAVHDRWLMMQLLHHLVGDHTTLEVMHAEVQAHLLEQVDRLPAPLPFRNLVAQARLGISQQEHEDFFRQMLGDVNEPTAPFGLLDVQGDGTSIQQAHLALSDDLAWRLRANARRLGVSTASLCHLAWARVLSKVSGREDVVFGTVLFGRMQGGEGADRVMGLFINTLPVRIAIGEEGVEAAVRHTHTLLADLLRHEHASLALAQRCSAVPAPAPLFSALLNYRHSPGAAQAPSQEAMQAWQGIRWLRGEERTNYPFTLSVNDLGEGFSLTAQTPGSVGPIRVCELMRTALASLVEALETTPATAVLSLEVLPASERHRVLYEWNDTCTEFPSDKCVHELFEAQAEKTPDAVAVVFEDKSLSYADLNRRANQLAHYLRELGVRPDDRVAICVERSLEMIVALMAVLKAGGAYVPLDPTYPTERLRFMLDDSSPVALLTQNHLEDLFSEPSNSMPVIDTTDATAWQEQPETNPDQDSIGLTPNHLAYVIYTSGSTGLPKGVLIEHRGLGNMVIAQILGFVVTSDSQVLQFASFSFDACVSETMMALCQGAVLRLLGHEQVIAGDVLMEVIAHHAITHATLPPAVLAGLPEQASLDSISVLVVAGDMLTDSLTKRWSHGRRLINAYGPTETTVCATLHECRVDELGNPPIGRPIANTRIYILDAYGEPVPVGVTGELYIGGAGVARGYLNRPEQTAEKFLGDPFVDEPGARMYRTGDLGRYLPDGNIEFLGRNDFQVKIRGFRIELGEIEAKLTEHPGVREAVVVAREDAPGDKRLVAYYTSSEEQETPEAGQLRSHLSVSLPDYMVPAAYVHLESLPLTPNGKLDRKALPAPDGGSYVTRGYEAPQGEIEQKLAAVWAEVLKLDHIGRYDNFFSLGGHSLLAVRVATRLRQALSVEVAIRDLFAQPVLADLAHLLESATPAELPPITGCNRGSVLPLSFAQQRLWFLAQMEGVSEAYHISFGLRLKGDLDRAALRRTLDRILARHEALRTTFPSVDEQPVQQIAAIEDSRFDLIEHDLREHGDAQTELARLGALEASASFDLEAGPLIRGRLIRLAEGEHALLITMHHIVSDGWSMGILTNELSTLYEALLHGEEDDPLPPLDIQYADYAVWQRQWIEGEILQQQAAYWKKTLANAPPLLELPTDHSRPTQRDYTGAFAGLALNEQLTAGLRELSRRHGTTLFMTLLAAWAAVLARLSGQQDVVIGTPTANRGRVEIENLIGFFVNTLALRIDLSGSPTVGELLRQAKAQVLAAQQHQDIPFEQVVELMQPVRSLSHSPLFQVMFAWQNATEGALNLAGLELLPLESSPHRVAKFDLTLSLQQTGNSVAGGIEYATSLFEQATVERYLGYFRTLLEGMVADDTQAVDRMPILPASERHRVLYEWNDTCTEFPSDKCVHELFEAQAEKTPDAVAVVFEDKSLSYADLNRRANQLAHYLRELGVRPDDRVAICVERSLEMIVALMAVLKAGGAYVPLDPTYPTERLRFMLDDSSPVALLTQNHLEDLFSEPSNSMPVIDTTDATAWQEQPETNPDQDSIGLTPNHLAYVIYTSGSTGLPKGVLIEHANVVRLFAATDAWFQFGGNDVWTLFHSYAFDFSVWEIWGPLLYGGRLIVVPKHIAQTPEDFYALLCREKVTVLNQTPSAFRQLSVAQGNYRDSHQLRYVIFGGEALEVATLQPWFEKDQERRTRRINMYGITETTVHVTYRVLEQEDTLRRGGSPIGCRIPDLRIYILDAYGEPVPVGVTGELYIGGAGVARGYLNRPEQTAEKFLGDPFVDEPGARMYRTGDLGRYLPDGNIEFLGRNDFQVKIRGFRIELGEIEAKLTEHPGVREAVVVAREDAPGDKRLVAYYTSSEEQETPEAGQLRSHLSVSLPDYMVPAAYVHLESLPLTPNGKLDRKALPAPDGGSYVTRGYEAPQGEIEQKLAAVWAEVLKLDHIGRYDNFFSLGGHSLLAVRVATRLRQALSVEVAIRDLFAQPVLADLAHLLESATPAELPPITGCNRGSVLPLSFAQQRLWFLAQMEGVSEAYHISFGLRLKGDLDRAALRRTLDRILARHEALRTTFPSVDEQPVQQIAAIEDSRFDLIEHDLREHGDAQTELARLGALEASASFDLEAGPLIRGRLIRLAEGEHALLITMHHIVSDGWSMGILTNELSTLYEALLHGEEDDPLPPLDIQYADYAVWQRQWIEGEILQQQAAYWKKTLANAPPLLELPTDHSRPTQRDYTGAFAGLALNEQLTAGLRELSRRHGTTLFMTLLAAWAAVLARLSGQQDVVIGTPTANRGRVEIENLIGFFVNTLALRIDLSGSPTVGELLRQAKAQVLAAQQHQDIPFEQVVELMQPVRSLSHSPLFQVMFAWQNATEGALNLAGLELLPLESSPHRVAKFDLTLSLQQTGNSVAGGIEYATSLFEQATVERYLGYFRTLLEGMVADDTQAVDRMPILPASERHRVLYEWNDTCTEFPSDKCVHELFEAQAEKTPDAVAVVFEDKSLSYADLNRRANQLAHYLRELGVRPDDRVAICVERSLEMIVALMAVLKAGGAYVPLDPTYPTERLRFMLDDSSPVALLTQNHLEDLFSEPSNSMPVIDTTDATAWQEQPETNPDQDSIGLTPNHLAYVIYTSGSTGLPKGVLIEHRGLGNLTVVHADFLDVKAKSRILQFASFSFDGCTFEVIMALGQGCSLHLAPQEEKLIGKALIHFVEKQGITHAVLPPAVLNTISEKDGLGTVNTLIVSGDILLDAPAHVWSHGRRLINGYGPTETTVCATLHECRVDELGNPPIGRPIANTRIYILDAYGEPVPVGVTGELYIGGAGVARGYLNRPEQTAEKFLGDPFVDEPGARMYRTGDLGRYLPDGNIEFLGRNDFQVKIRGFRIELGEIEAKLTEHPGVREAVVVAREDAPGDKRLVAYYTSSEEQETPEAGQLRSHLSVSLPDYMVPAAYVHLESLPLTPNGKLDRKALPAPDGGSYVTRGYEAPQGEIEQKLAAVWAEVLKLDHIGRYDNFFSLGGHSLLAILTVALLKKSSIIVPPTDLFLYPTISSLAEQIHSHKTHPSDDEAILIREGAHLPPLFLTHCGGGELVYAPILAKHIAHGIPVYGLTSKPLEDSPLRTMEEMATRMVRMIRKVQPVGPYHIAGYSLGGIIAYEIAAQLIGADQKVNFLGLLDTQHYGELHAHDFHQNHHDNEDTINTNSHLPLTTNFGQTDDRSYYKSRLLRIAKSVAGTNEYLLSSAELLESFLGILNFVDFAAKCKRLSLLPEHLYHLTPKQIELHFDRSHAYGLAARRYSVRELPIPIQLFVAMEGHDSPNTLNWETILRADCIRVNPVPGGHVSQMFSPNVEILGKKLSDAILDDRGTPQ